MTPELVNLLTQIPLVAAFMWFALELQRRYAAEAASRSTEFVRAIDRQTDAMTANTIALRAITASLEAHEKKADGIGRVAAIAAADIAYVKEKLDRAESS
jgi:hypothetical protein